MLPGATQQLRLSHAAGRRPIGQWVGGFRRTRPAAWVAGTHDPRPPRRLIRCTPEAGGPAGERGTPTCAPGTAARHRRRRCGLGCGRAARPAIVLWWSMSCSSSANAADLGRVVSESLDYATPRPGRPTYTIRRSCRGRRLSAGRGGPPSRSRPNATMRTGPAELRSLIGSPDHGLTSSRTRSSAKDASASAGSASIWCWTCSSAATRYTYMPALARVTSRGSSLWDGLPGEQLGRVAYRVPVGRRVALQDRVPTPVLDLRGPRVGTQALEPGDRRQRRPALGSRRNGPHTATTAVRATSTGPRRVSTSTVAGPPSHSSPMASL